MDFVEAGCRGLRSEYRFTMKGALSVQPHSEQGILAAWINLLLADRRRKDVAEA
jgi:hypothetical protein